MHIMTIIIIILPDSVLTFKGNQLTDGRTKKEKGGKNNGKCKKVRSVPNGCTSKGGERKGGNSKLKGMEKEDTYMGTVGVFICASMLF